MYVPVYVDNQFLSMLDIDEGTSANVIEAAALVLAGDKAGKLGNHGPKRVETSNSAVYITTYPEDNDL